MEPKQVTQLIDSIAQQEIDPNMDLWHGIHDQIQSKRQTPVTLRVARIALLIMILAVVSTGAYAFYQRSIGDPGIEGAADAGLFHEIEESQTIDGVTVTLRRAYADLQRFVIEYTVRGVSAEMVRDSITSGQKLQDTMGNTFSFTTGGLTEESTPDEITVSIQYYTQAVREEGDAIVVDNEYFTSQYPTIPEHIDFILTLDFYRDVYGDPIIENPPAPFIFEFSVPLNAGLILEPNATVEDQGIAVTVERITLSPSQTEIRLCHELPDSRDWQPVAHLLIGDEPAFPSGWGMVSTDEFLNTERRCRDMRFDGFYEGAPVTLSLTVDRLETSMPEGPAEWEQIRDILATHDIHFDVVFEQHGLRLENLQVPEGIDFDEAVREARIELGNIIEGDWSFTFDTP